MAQVQLADGVVEQADDKSFRLNGAWYKYSTKGTIPDHVSAGQKVRITYIVSEWQGKSYNWVSRTQVLDGGSTTMPAREDGITWANAINAAVECLKANLDYSARIKADEPPAPITPMLVAMFAQVVYESRPWAQPEEPQEPDSYDGYREAAEAAQEEPA